MSFSTEQRITLYPRQLVSRMRVMRPSRAQTKNQEKTRREEFLLVAEYTVVIPSACSRMRQHFMNCEVKRGRRWDSGD
jgi:hypothetical protein